jgi:hypothetical protein
MATFDYAATAATALRLLAQFGTTATVTRTTGSANTDGDGLTGTGSTTFSVTLLSVPASGGTVEAFDDRMRELYVRGKLRFFICQPAAGSAVQDGDTLPWDGETYRVSGATTVKPDGSTMLVQKFGAAAV